MIDVAQDSAICRRDSGFPEPPNCDKGNSVSSIGLIEQIAAAQRPSLARNADGIIIDSFGDVSIPRQCVTLAVVAHKVGKEGFTDQEAAHLTIPLLGNARVIIDCWLSVMLPGFSLETWAVWTEPCPCEEPF